MGEHIDKHDNQQKANAIESAQIAPQMIHIGPIAAMEFLKANIASGSSQPFPKKGKASPWGNDEVKVKAWLAAKIQTWAVLVTSLLHQGIADRRTW